MKQYLLCIRNRAGLIVVLLFLLTHLLTMDAYGFTWDFHFHFFGGGKLLGIEPMALEPRNLPFVEPDPRRAWTLPYGPLMSIPPVASYLLFHKALALLPADTSYHLPIVLWGISGIAILYLFIKEAINRRAALFAALFLGLTPRYFGDLHNNMKDIPSAVAFALNIWLLWRLVRHRRPIDLILAVIGFAVAFNVKINSIFIPIIFVTWLLLLWLRQKRVGFTMNYSLFTIYFLTAPIMAFLLWWVFWPDPIGQLRHAFFTFGIGTNNIEVLLNGTWYCSGSTVPWYYPWWYLAITTPLPILIFFLIGLMKQMRPIGILLILWLVLPLTRYFLPTVGVIDGIRHFEEVLFPIAIFAALGADWIIVKSSAAAFRLTTISIFAIVICHLIWNIVSYHPYQITYFNELVGGVRGALGKYDLDYWGTSQKAAVEWVNATAPQHAKVYIVMAAAVAGQYLRPDLITNLNKYGYDDSDFVIFLNRQSFFYRFFYAYEYLLSHRPAHTISVRGAALTWIYDNRTHNKTPRQTPWWQDEDPCIIKYWRGEHL